MIDKFLKAKHWQLFLLTFCLPLIVQLITIISMVILSNSDGSSDTPFIINYIQFIPITMLVSMGVFFGWFWSVVIGLLHKVPQNITIKVKRFKIFFFIPLVYILMIILFIISLTNGVEPNPLFFILFIPLHLLSMFGIFHSLYYVAKVFKTIELQKEVSFSDFAGEFFMIWFFPIGIWLIQPKINKMVN